MKWSWARSFSSLNLRCLIQKVRISQTHSLISTISKVPHSENQKHFVPHSAARPGLNWSVVMYLPTCCEYSYISLRKGFVCFLARFSSAHWEFELLEHILCSIIFPTPEKDWNPEAHLAFRLRDRGPLQCPLQGCGKDGRRCLVESTWHTFASQGPFSLPSVPSDLGAAK